MRHLATLLAFLMPLAHSLSAQTDPVIRPGGSADVLYSFPDNPSEISVGRNGENTFALEIPSFPGYLKPSISASYSSRGTDSVMGVGWSLAIPEIMLDLSSDRTRAAVPPADQATKVGETLMIRNRWASNQAGPLVCEGARDTKFISDFDCFSDPHGPTRFKPIGEVYAQGWKAQDPYEGVTQYYGEDAASQLRADTGNTVGWLLSREVTEFGAELRYFYEERAGSNQRILRAVLGSGDRIIRFNYGKRGQNRSISYSRGLRRGQEWLLQEIELVTGCRPEQIISSASDLWTDFSSCRNETVIEKVQLSYSAPETRYTGHYALKRWQRMDPSENLRFGAATFTYNGDGRPTRGTTTGNVVVTQSPDFAPPDGYSMITNSADGPVQNLVDWNRDGHADWVSVKADDSRQWPDPEVAEHNFFVRLRMPFGGYGSPQAYRDPLARYAVWLDGEKDGYRRYFRDYLDRSFNLTDQRIVRVNPSGLTGAVAQVHPDAGIGIETAPWLRNSRSTDANTGKPRAPDRSLFKSLSMTVACTDRRAEEDEEEDRREDRRDGLGAEICTDLRANFSRVWADRMGYLRNDDSMGVKLTDLADMNGDGYLDRLVSGLLVTWDPSAPDADSDGFRDPVAGDPAIYVSYFDPAADDFRPFTRYSIAPLDGEFANLSSAFLSALAVNITRNGNTSPADMSNQSAPRSLAVGLGVAAQGYGLYETFKPQHAAADAPTHQSGSSTTFSQASQATGGLLTAASLVANAADAPPETMAALSHARTVHSGISGTKSAIDSAQAISVAADGPATALGWAQFSTAVVGVASQTINAVWRANSASKLKKGGYSAQAVVSQTKTGTAIISFVAATVSLVAAIIVLSGAAGATMNPVGWFISGVLAILALALTLNQLFSADDVWETANGRIKVEYKTQRGVVYRGNSLQHDNSERFDLLDWTDLDGDMRPDLLIGGFDGRRGELAVALGDKSDVIPGEFPTPATGMLMAWPIEDGSGVVPTGIRRNAVDTRYELRDSHRGDMITGEVSLMDINGDQLVDYVYAMRARIENGVYVAGYRAYLNDGTGFRDVQEFRVPQQFLPSGIQVVPKLSRSRGLYWTEFAGKTRGYSIGLNNLIQTLGPDIDNNGLPDLIVKDEASYPAVAAQGNCVLESPSAISVRPLPMDPEPEPNGGNNCTAGENNWFTRFDGLIASELVYGEGVTHLSPAAFQVHSPSQQGTHFVAFNTGTGFTPFVELTQEMPSLGGSFSVVSVVPDTQGSPSFAVSGTSNALIDHDGSGVRRLVAMDIANSDIHDLNGTHPVTMQARIGLPNADVLTQMFYPDGGQVNFTYRLKKDINGPQGPPLWVLARADFDDRVRAGLAALQGWTATQPFVNYEYLNARWRGEEYLGFEAIAETRFSGQTYSQIIQSFYQEGAERGMPRCTEVRGRMLDNFAQTIQGGARETAICTANEDASQSIGVAEPLLISQNSFVAPSCSSDASSALAGRMMPLLQRIETVYDTDQSLPAVQGAAEELRRVVLLDTFSTTTFNGQDTGAMLAVNVNYGPFPYLVPTRSEAQTNDNLSRSENTTWTIHDDPAMWLFHKATSERLNSDGSPALTTRFVRDTQYPYPLAQIISQSPDGDQRIADYADLNAAGLPQQVTESGITKKYQYADDYQNGTGLLVRAEVEAGVGQSDKSVETYAYDAMGRIVSHTNAYGAVSTHTYDALGLKLREILPERGVREYTHRNIGDIDVARSEAALSASQRTALVEQIGGEQIMSMSYWDGFGRAFRTLSFIEGHQIIDLDFDSDKEPDVTHPFRNDRQWFTARNASRLVQDAYLSADGAIQCASTPYLNDQNPRAFTTNLLDGMRRVVFTRDMMGFGSQVLRGVDVQSGQQWQEIRDGMSRSAMMQQDGFDRQVLTRRNNQREMRYVFDDWDHLIASTDANGIERRWERNVWGQATRECAPAKAGQSPSGITCPDKWPTWQRTFDQHGRLTQVRDPEGGQIDVTPSSCAAPAQLIGPSVSDQTAIRPTFTTQFDSACRVTAITEENGPTNRFEYDKAGKLVTSIIEADKVERTTRYGYDARGRRVYVQNPRGARVYQFYDFRDLPVETWSSPDHVSYSDFDLNGALTSLKRPSGRGEAYAHDLMGRMTTRSQSAEVCDSTQIDAGIFATNTRTVTARFEYDRSGQLVRAIGPDGAASGLEWNGFGEMRGLYPPRLSNPSVPDPTAGVTMERDAAGHLSAVQSPSGLRHEYGHDGMGRVINTVIVGSNGTSRQMTTQRDALGRVIGVTPPNDAGARSCVAGKPGENAYLVSTQYAPSGAPLRSVSAADSDGVRSWVERAYTQNALPSMITDSSGAISQIRYSRFQETETMTDQWGRTWGWQYNNLGQLAQTSTPAGYETRYRYDMLNRLIETTDSRDVVSTFAYDPDGLLTSQGVQADLATNRWQGRFNTHDLSGRVISRSLASFIGATAPAHANWNKETTLAMCHDMSGRVQAVQDDEGRMVQYLYNARGQLTEKQELQQSSNWVSTQYTIDASGLLVQLERPLSGTQSVVAKISYNAFGEPILKSYSELKADRRFEYDDSGNLCGITDVVDDDVIRQQAFTYDPRGRLISNEVSDGQMRSRKFGGDGTLVEAEDETGNWQYLRGAEGRLQHVQQTVNRLGQTFETAYDYGPTGKLATVQLPRISGMPSPPLLEFKRDPKSGLLRTITVNGDLAYEAVDHDGLGRTTKWTLGPTNGQSRYGPDGQLSELHTEMPGQPLFHTQFSRDDAGLIINIEDRIDPDYTSKFTYDSRSRLISEDNTAMGGTREYKWTDLDVVSFETGARQADLWYLYDAKNGALVAVDSGAQQQSMKNDPFGNRLADKLSGYELDFDHLDRVIRLRTADDLDIELEYDHEGRRIRVGNRYFIYGVGRHPLAEIEVDSKDRITRAQYNIHIAGKLAIQIDARTQEPQYFVTDHRASPVVEIASGGRIIAEHAFDAFGGDIPRDARVDEPMATNTGFMGAYRLLPDRSLYLMGHRVYDAATARFLSRDPLGANSQGSLYGFALANPHHFWDPSGLEPQEIKDCTDVPSCRELDFEDGISTWVSGGMTPTPAPMPPAPEPATEVVLPTSNAIMSGRYDFYANLLTLESLSNAGGTMLTTVTDRNNSMGSALYAADQLTAAPFIATMDTGKGKSMAADGAYNGLVAVSQLTADVPYLLITGVTSPIKNAGSLLQTYALMPVALATNDSQWAYDLGKTSAGLELSLTTDIALLGLGRAALKQRPGSPAAGFGNGAKRGAIAGLGDEIVLYHGSARGSVRKFADDMANGRDFKIVDSRMHDMGDGLYLAEDIAVARQYAGPDGVIFEVRIPRPKADSFTDISIQSLDNPSLAGAHRAEFLEAGEFSGNYLEGSPIGLRSSAARTVVNSGTLDDLFEPNFARGQLFNGNAPPGSEFHPAGLGFEYSHVQWRMKHPTNEIRQQIIDQARTEGLYP